MLASTGKRPFFYCEELWNKAIKLRRISLAFTRQAPYKGNMETQNGAAQEVNVQYQKKALTYETQRATPNAHNQEHYTMTNIATFNTAGVSRQFGKLKIRMANDIEWRQFMLKHEGHVDIQLVAFGRQMPKTEAIQLAMAHTTVVDGVETPTFGAEAQACFVKYLQDQGVIEKPKLKRGRKAKAEAVAEAVEGAQEEAVASEESNEVAADTPSEELVAAVTLTLEDIPKRDEKGRLLSGESRRQMLAERLAEQGEVA